MPKEKIQKNEVPVHRRRASVFVLRGLPGRTGRSHIAGLGPADTAESTEMQPPGQNLLHSLTLHLLNATTECVCVNITCVGCSDHMSAAVHRSPVEMSTAAG